MGLCHHQAGKGHPEMWQEGPCPGLLIPGAPPPSSSPLLPLGDASPRQLRALALAMTRYLLNLDSLPQWPKASFQDWCGIFTPLLSAPRLMGVAKEWLCVGVRDELGGVGWASTCMPRVPRVEGQRQDTPRSGAELRSLGALEWGLAFGRSRRCVCAGRRTQHVECRGVLASVLTLKHLDTGRMGHYPRPAPDALSVGVGLAPGTGATRLSGSSCPLVGQFLTSWVPLPLCRFPGPLELWLVGCWASSMIFLAFLSLSFLLFLSVC